jgi:uncharacterized protein YbjT (DUF2867 family)
MRVVVTGASGNVGTTLVRALAGRGGPLRIREVVTGVGAR